MSKVLNIRSVPEVLMRGIKSESGKKGLTIRDFVLGTLAIRVGVSYGSNVEKIKDSPRATTAKTDDAAVVAEVPDRASDMNQEVKDPDADDTEHKPLCPACEGPLVEWKGKLGCKSCDRIFDGKFKFKMS